MQHAYNAYTTDILEGVMQRTGMDLDSARALCRLQIDSIYSSYTRTERVSDVVSHIILASQEQSH